MSELSLLQRLQKRRVLRTAGYYIVGSWLLLQVGDVIVEPAGLPAWSMTALLYALVLGFPAVLFLGWRYDLTEHGLVRTTRSSEEEYDPEAIRLRWVDYLVFLALAGVVTLAAYQLLPVAQQVDEAAQQPATSPDRVNAESIAVLPFADLSQGGDQQFLGDGISDTVMHVLAQVEGLQVTARTSSFAFKGQNKSIPEIAQALRVAHVLEGSVQAVGEQVRIIARLIEAQTGVEVWSGYYDRAVSSVFDIQDEIAQEVTTALMVKVLNSESVAVEAGYQPDLAAFEQLVLGRQALDRDTAEAYVEAYERFEKAIEIDPDYALAYVMLGRSIPPNSMRLGLQRADGVARVIELTEKALDLDPLLPEAHEGLAAMRLANKRFVEAEQSARRALELRPSYAGAYTTLADIYLTQRRYDEALDAARRAVELDPEEWSHQDRLAQALWDVGRSEAAVVVLRDTIERHPEVPTAYQMLSRYLRQLGRSGEALYWDERALQLDPDSPYRFFSYCQGLLQVWAVDEAIACIEEHLAANPDDGEAINWLAGLRGDSQLGLENALAAVERNSNSWYRKMQLSEWLVQARRYEETIELFRTAFPPLYQNPPVVDDMTIWVARNLVQSYQGLGQEARANALIDAALDHLSRQRKLQGTGLTTGTDDAVFLALKGDLDEAIERLEQAIGRDWQFFSFQLATPELRANLPQALRNDPRFKAQVERMRAIMGEEYAWYLEHRGKPLPGTA